MTLHGKDLFLDKTSTDFDVILGLMGILFLEKRLVFKVIDIQRIAS